MAAMNKNTLKLESLDFIIRFSYSDSLQRSLYRRDGLDLSLGTIIGLQLQPSLDSSLWLSVITSIDERMSSREQENSEI
jgi:hypothetical protein